MGQGLRTEWLASGRRRVKPVGIQQSTAAAQVFGLTDDALIYRAGDRLLAVDLEEGHTLWSRLLNGGDVEAVVNERYVTLFADGQEAVVHDAVDGAIVARRPVGDRHEWLHLDADRLMVLEWLPDGLACRVDDLVQGAVLWRHVFPRGSRGVVIRNEVLFCSPQGELQARDRATGRPLWQTQLPPGAQLSFLWGQRHGSTYWVCVGNSSPVPDQVRLATYQDHQQTFTGLAAAIDVAPADATGVATASVRWTQLVGPTAFDVLQPATLPLLCFAARMMGPATAPGFLPAQTTATFLDRRTGDVVYSTTEALTQGGYQFQIDGDRRQLLAAFQQWQLEFHLTP
jgi:hypothetical protein